MALAAGCTDSCQNALTPMLTLPPLYNTAVDRISTSGPAFRNGSTELGEHAREQIDAQQALETTARGIHVMRARRGALAHRARARGRSIVIHVFIDWVIYR